MVSRKIDVKNYAAVSCSIDMKKYIAASLYIYEKSRGQYIGKYPPPLKGGNISDCHLGGKIWKAEEKKGEYVKEKGRKGKEKEKRGSKMAK